MSIGIGEKHCFFYGTLCRDLFDYITNRNLILTSTKQFSKSHLDQFVQLGKANHPKGLSPAGVEYRKVYNRLKARTRRGKISRDEWNAIMSQV